MTRGKDPTDVVATIRRSIEVSRKRSRMVLFRRLRHLFGFKAWSPERRVHIQQLLCDAGVVARPSLADVQGDEWVHLSLVDDEPPVSASSPEKAPPTEFFDYLDSLDLNSEREVELHFASPLFHHLGYDDSQEACGYRFDTWHGVQHRAVEADLLYFADHIHDLASGTPLVLVECKTSTKEPDTGLGQVRSYAFWVKPAYYVLTNGDLLSVYLYQGGSVPDIKQLEVPRKSLSERFGELYSLLNPMAAAEARRQKLALIASQTPVSPFALQTENQGFSAPAFQKE